MSKGLIIDTSIVIAGSDFVPDKGLESRYANKKVNEKYYHKLTVDALDTNWEKKDRTLEYLISKYEFYEKNRNNPYLSARYLALIILNLEKRIVKKHCE